MKRISKSHFLKLNIGKTSRLNRLCCRAYSYSAPHNPSWWGSRRLGARGTQPPRPCPKPHPLGPLGLDSGLSRTTFGNVPAPVDMRDYKDYIFDGGIAYVNMYVLIFVLYCFSV